ncbi:hypothetical protein ZIOFF_069846 [Zingiber officinale]|uniref:CCR4-NOT transcription complex subunit 9 n=1 Tax=Zingiber officinale TaxID=94328 RepID=A0A8J5EV85_ZINOF|nr:hypothetical protein ZIOFF_069846 [Zingiber officinale]
MNHPSPAFGVGSAAPPPPPPAAHCGAAGRDWRTSVEQFLSDLTDRNLRENALLELSKLRILFTEMLECKMPVYLWMYVKDLDWYITITMGIEKSVFRNSIAPPVDYISNHGFRSRKLFIFGHALPFVSAICAIFVWQKRDIFHDLAPLLWHSFGSIAALLQILSYDSCLSTHFAAHIPLYLYPFLNTTSKTRPFEYLRLTSLGVIGALVKVDETEVIGFLLRTEIIPLCLRTMEMGSELSKTVATFIVQKILLDDVGLSYICATSERFYAVGQVLGSMVTSLAERPSVRLLKHIIRCYLRLSEHQRYALLGMLFSWACERLINYLPDILKDGSINSYLHDSGRRIGLAKEHSGLYYLESTKKKNLSPFTFTSVKRSEIGGKGKRTRTIPLFTKMACEDDPGTRHWLQQLLHNVNTANRATNHQGRLDHIIGS